jgi:excisionase family DNA binding protein
MRPIKLSEAAKKLGITKKTLYVWKKDGKIDFIRIGGLKFLDYDIFL